MKERILTASPRILQTTYFLAQLAEAFDPLALVMKPEEEATLLLLDGGRFGCLALIPQDLLLHLEQLQLGQRLLHGGLLPQLQEEPLLLGFLHQELLRGFRSCSGRQVLLFGFRFGYTRLLGRAPEINKQTKRCQIRFKE